MTKECPKCRYQSLSSDSASQKECPKCGLVYAKYEAFLLKKQEKSKKKSEVVDVKLSTSSPPSDTTSNYRKFLLFSVSICLVIGVSLAAFFLIYPKVLHMRTRI